MKPTLIDGAAVSMTPPDGWNEERHGECGVIQARVVNGNYSMGWRPSPEELAKLAAGACVVVSMVGGVAPHFVEVEDDKGPRDMPSALREGETIESREAAAADAFEASRKRQEEIIAAMKRPVFVRADEGGDAAPEEVEFATISGRVGVDFAAEGADRTVGAIKPGARVDGQALADMTKVHVANMPNGATAFVAAPEALRSQALDVLKAEYRIADLEFARHNGATEELYRRANDCEALATKEARKRAAIENAFAALGGNVHDLHAEKLRK